ncbi:MAG: adenosine deaminase [Bacteroidota bacterium]|nr:adenosine deaminase [Bacteroidota bacterium]MDP4190874.1 adenosine deaminase [Bacteroidota bacterium]MDP4195148.1 adenosine deaminase [Bacteroidota bacterium]
MTDNNLKQIIHDMPKVELHLHLEGAFTFDFLFGQLQKYGDDRKIKTIDELKSRFVFSDFNHFIETWFWKNRYFRSEEDFEESAYQTLKELARQNVVYSEVYFSPWDFIPGPLKVEQITEATLSAIHKAERDFNIKCGLIADLIRNLGHEAAVKRLDEVTPYLNKGIIGVGLGGSEKDFPAKPFKDVFLQAKRRGFRTVAHAGEADGAESVWSALIDLKAERIGHGVRAIEDNALVDYLREKQIPLEVCITSNIKTRIFSSLEEHPFDKFYKKGLMVTINSDDPTMFGSDITSEFELLADQLGYSAKDLFSLTENAISSSFLDNCGKNEIKATLKNFISETGKA